MMTDYVTAKKLNLEAVGRYFEGKGYKVQKLEQIYRQVTGQVKFENEKLFLKLSSTPDIGERTRNEKQWNENMNRLWKKHVQAFRVPRIFDCGTYDGNYWFTADYVFGKPMAEISGKKSDIDEKDIAMAGEIAKEIMSISEITLLPKDIGHLKPVWKDRVVEVATNWSKEIKRDTNKLLRYIEETADNIEMASCHGDFTPWHILKTKDKQYFVIDSESAQVAGLKYYDVAYFYHRVYTKLKRPDLAEMYLKKFKEIDNWTEKQELVFAPVLAARIMGGYFDAERDGVTSLDLNQELEDKIIKK